MKNRKRGFTLIELLVVVLIIGILSAIALPQYQKAVIKARATELQTLTRSLATAQAAYFMANSQYADSLDDLDLSFPLTPAPEIATAMGVDDGAISDKSIIGVRKADGSAYALFASGPYAYKAGFVVHGNWSSGLKNGDLYCVEVGNDVDFCHKFYGGTLADTGLYESKFYTMP